MRPPFLCIRSRRQQDRAHLQGRDLLGVERGKRRVPAVELRRDVGDHALLGDLRRESLARRCCLGRGKEEGVHRRGGAAGDHGGARHGHVAAGGARRGGGATRRLHCSGLEARGEARRSRRMKGAAVVDALQQYHRPCVRRVLSSRAILQQALTHPRTREDV
eukprot:365634-Chlamydomonas_euryale.AAC.21